MIVYGCCIVVVINYIKFKIVILRRTVDICGAVAVNIGRTGVKANLIYGIGYLIVIAGSTHPVADNKCRLPIGSVCDRLFKNRSSARAVGI